VATLVVRIGGEVTPERGGLTGRQAAFRKNSFLACSFPSFALLWRGRGPGSRFTPGSCPAACCSGLWGEENDETNPSRAADNARAWGGDRGHGQRGCGCVGGASVRQRRCSPGGDLGKRTTEPVRTGTGGGIWLWIELDGSQSGGTGDYTGSDCLHHTPISPQTGAVADSGDVSWTSDGTTITITGVVIGGDTAVTITVPESGHLSTNDLSSVFSAPVGEVPGTAQVQVAP
jgi:hypothetical protein